MSNLDQLRQDVIDAARDCVMNSYMQAHDDCHAGSDVCCLCSALDALEKAEKPDPWLLLSYVWNRLEEGVSISIDTTMDNLPQMIGDALAWRERNPDENCS